ncbi:MAG: hypothetical protein KME23_06890 [Goleter apudmare HA4340-LM2]|nr:hypothetical protein [Goleter apudmare HA4340-LM2]
MIATQLIPRDELRSTGGDRNLHHLRRCNFAITSGGASRVLRRGERMVFHAVATKLLWLRPGQLRIVASPCFFSPCPN